MGVGYEYIIIKVKTSLLTTDFCKQSNLISIILIQKLSIIYSKQIKMYF